MDATATQTINSFGPAPGFSRVRLAQTERDVELLTKDGNFGISGARAPEAVLPGDPIGVEIDVFNGYVSSIQVALDPDNCENAANPCSSGIIDVAPICYVATLSPDWDTPAEFGPACLGGNPLTVPTRTHSTQFTAPDTPGQTRHIDITLEHPGSGEVAQTSIPVAVASEDQQCATNADCPGDFVCENGVCVEPGGNGNGNGDGGFLGNIQNILLLLIVLAGVVLISRGRS